MLKKLFALIRECEVLSVKIKSMSQTKERFELMHIWARKGEEIARLIAKAETTLKSEELEKVKATVEKAFPGYWEAYKRLLPESMQAMTDQLLQFYKKEREDGN